MNNSDDSEWWWILVIIAIIVNNETAMLSREMQRIAWEMQINGLTCDPGNMHQI